jgi:hypothetical protein
MQQFFAKMTITIVAAVLALVGRNNWGPRIIRMIRAPISAAVALQRPVRVAIPAPRNVGGFANIEDMKYNIRSKSRDYKEFLKAERVSRASNRTEYMREKLPHIREWYQSVDAEIQGPFIPWIDRGTIRVYRKFSSIEEELNSLKSRLRHYEIALSPERSTLLNTTLRNAQNYYTNNSYEHWALNRVSRFLYEFEDSRKNLKQHSYKLKQWKLERNFAVLQFALDKRDNFAGRTRSGKTQILNKLRLLRGPRKVYYKEIEREYAERSAEWECLKELNIVTDKNLYEQNWSHCSSLLEEGRNLINQRNTRK